MSFSRLLFGLMCLFVSVGVAGPSLALEECNFDFKVSAESTAFQVLSDRARAEGGIWESIKEAPEDVRAVAKYVGLLQICYATPDGKPRITMIQNVPVELASPLVTACTATLLPGNRLLTNRHCFYPPDLRALGFEFVQEARVSFGYVSEDDTSGVQTYSVLTQEISADTDLDAMILQIVGGDANEDVGGHFPLRMQTEVRPFQELKIVHFPNGQPQRYSSGTCKVHRAQRDLSEEATSLRHTCETTLGSSGSLILDGRSLSVVGLHNLGGLNDKDKGYNSGHRIQPIDTAFGLGFKDEDACDNHFDQAKASNTCSAWGSYAAQCGAHSGIFTANLAIKLCKAGTAETTPQPDTATAPDGGADTTTAGNFQKGLNAYNKGDYATALLEWKPLAAQGDAPAQANLGGMYETDEVSPRTTRKLSGGSVSRRNRGMRGRRPTWVWGTPKAEVSPRTTPKRSGGTVLLRNRDMRGRRPTWVGCTETDGVSPRTTRKLSGGSVLLRNRGMRGRRPTWVGCTSPDVVSPRTTPKRSGGTVSRRNRGMLGRRPTWVGCTETDGVSPRTTRKLSGGTVLLRNRDMRGRRPTWVGCTSPDVVSPRTTRRLSGGIVSLRNRGMRTRSQPGWMYRKGRRCSAGRRRSSPVVSSCCGTGALRSAVQLGLMYDDGEVSPRTTLRQSGGIVSLRTGGCARAEPT